MTQGPRVSQKNDLNLFGVSTAIGWGPKLSPTPFLGEYGDSLGSKQMRTTKSDKSCFGKSINRANTQNKEKEHGDGLAFEFK